MTTQLDATTRPRSADSALDLMETIFLLLGRCQASPAGPDGTPGMRLIRAAMAAAEDAPDGPELDRRFWAVVLRDLAARPGE